MTIRAMQAFPPVIALLDSIQPPMQFGRARRFFHGALPRLPFLPFSRATRGSHESMGCKAWDSSPFIKFMGVNVITRSPERSEAELVNRDDLCNRRDVMHGGAIMALADIMGGMTASASLAPNQATATIESKTNFFAPIPRATRCARCARRCIPAAPPSCCRPTSPAATAASPPW